MCAALPDADFLRFDKMPWMVEGRVNPLALLPQARQSLTNSNVVAIDGGWSDYISTFERTFRKELERSWRVFLRHDGATFRQIEDRAEAMIVFAELERQQSERLVGSGAGYNLDRPEMAAFYRKLVADGIGDGGVVLTALTCRDEVVAALLGGRARRDLCDDPHLLRLKGMVQLLARPACHHADDADASCARLPALRFLYRGLRL